METTKGDEVLSARLKKGKTGQVSKPRVVYVQKDVTSRIGVIHGLIFGDAAFWLIMQQRPEFFRGYHDWAKWFCCSERTIQRAVKKLSDFGFFKTRRSSFGDGKQGTLYFSLTRSVRETEIYEEYRSFRDDYCETAGLDEFEYTRQAVSIEFLERYGVNEAVVLCRLLGPLMGQHEVATFVNQGALKDFCWMSKSRCLKALDRLIDLGGLRKHALKERDHAFMIVPGPRFGPVREWYEDWVAEREVRHPLGYLY